MIVITGAAGFIASCLAGELNKLNFNDLVLVDYFGVPEKAKNHRSKKHNNLVDRKAFFHWAKGKEKHIEFIFHLGARTNTFETDTEIFKVLNLEYSQSIWNYCSENSIPMIYASSAATYGDGSNGFSDNNKNLALLKPLNEYAKSKHSFDLWVTEQKNMPPFWAGLKFFNVFGPNEYHKEKMASVVFHAYHQIKDRGYLELFKSHKSEYNNGEQVRDFIYVNDVVKVLLHLMNTRKNSGLYNVGTGKARSFNDLGEAVFNALDMNPDIRYIDMPIEIRDSYQYKTEAEIVKLTSIGYQIPFTSLEDAIKEYIQVFLTNEAYY